MNILAKIEVGKGKLIVKLPLTNPTGKIRVKRRGKTSNYGKPIATRREVFKENDYVEWQISYATDNPPVESKVEDIRLNGQVGFELTKLLCEGIKLGILSSNDVQDMEIFIGDVNRDDTLEENEEILREETKYEVKGGFKKFVGFEIEESYWKLAQKRVSKFVNRNTYYQGKLFFNEREEK